MCQCVTSSRQTDYNSSGINRRYGPLEDDLRHGSIKSKLQRAHLRDACPPSLTQLPHQHTSTNNLKATDILWTEEIIRATREEPGVSFRSLYFLIFTLKIIKKYIIKALANILHLDNFFLCLHRGVTVESRPRAQVKIIYDVAFIMKHQWQKTGSNILNPVSIRKYMIFLWRKKSNEPTDHPCKITFIWPRRPPYSSFTWGDKCFTVSYKHVGNKPLVFRLTVGVVEMS